MDNSRKTKLNKSIVALALLACLVAFSDLWSTNPNDSYHQQQKTGAIHFGNDFVNDSETRQLEQVTEDSSNNEPPPPPTFAVCGREAGSDLASWPLQRKYLTCPEFDPQTPILVLEGYKTFGRTGNRLQSLLHAMQYARDAQSQLGIMYDSWAMGVILEFFIASDNEGNDDDWKSQIEKTLCVKIIHRPEELEGWKVILENPEDLFNYRSSSPFNETRASKLYTLRTLFQHYNTGEGHDQHGNAVGDMCSGIDSVFGKEGEHDRSSAIYSVIHLRYLEGRAGRNILAYVAHVTGCDPMAALEMKPDYVKSMLAPLGMLEHPIIVITDGQNKLALERLLSDPDIGPMIRQVKPEESSFGGDITLAVMANVFIGNPASSVSGFIAKSRVSLGFGNNFLHRAKDENGEWTTVCGDDCLFAKDPVESWNSWWATNQKAINSKAGEVAGDMPVPISRGKKRKIRDGEMKDKLMARAVAGDTSKLQILALEYLLSKVRPIDGAKMYND